jgi:hypothetical protein
MSSASRRGSALILVLIMTLSLAALAASAIYMTGSSGLLSRYHDKERDLTFALETAIELGKSRLQRDTTLVLYDTGYKQLLTNQQVYTSGGTPLTGVTVDLYGGYTGDTSGTYVPYITLVATVSDPGGIRLARRLDLYAQSFARYAFFTNDFPSAASIGAGENMPGRVHANNRFIASSSGAPNPVFSDTVSAAGTISGNAQWADTVSATGGATVIPYPSAAATYWGASSMRVYFSGLATLGSLSTSVQSGTQTKATSGGIDVSGSAGANASPGTRLEFVTIDVNNNGMIDSSEGFYRVFHQYPSSYSSGTYWIGGEDTTRLSVNFSGTPVATSNQVLTNQCGAFYTIGGRREFFPIAMHHVAWVQTRIQTSTYPTVIAAQAAAMAAVAGVPAYPTQAAVRIIAQQPTARCFPQGSPYLMNVERFSVNSDCTNDWWSAGARYTFGSSFNCAVTGQQYGGQDTTWTLYIFTCPVDLSDAAGRCTGTTDYAGYWDSYNGTNNTPAFPASVRQNVERPYLFPISRVYNPNSRGVAYVSGHVFLFGTLRGYLTMYVNGTATIRDDINYDVSPADTANLCRNFFGLIARDSVLVSDNATNRPRVYDTPAGNAGNTLTLGTNRELLFHGIAMALGGPVSAYNPGVATMTNPAYTCPVGSSFTSSGGCLHVVGGTIMSTYVAPYVAATTGSGLRPLRERDPCQRQNRRPPYFPLAATRVQALRGSDVDVRQIKTSALLTAYYARLRGARAAP